jgi:hypothetical protein
MSPETSAVFERNMAAFGRRHAGLAAHVRSSAPNPVFIFLTARDGSTVPAVRLRDRDTSLHSLYDPSRAARSLFASSRGAGCIVFFGLGAGFQIDAFLEDPETCSVLVIEKDAGTLRALFERVGYATLLEDTRVHITVGLEGIRAGLCAAWQPALIGGLRSVPLGPWCELERVFFQAAAAELEGAVAEVRSDYSVQSHFGKRWFSNMLLNLEAAEHSGTGELRGSRARVTAAGPSLDAQMKRLGEAEREGFLLACDTSLPALLTAGIPPDAVLSVDCQNHGYHHFFKGLPQHTRMFLDLASPPLLARRTTRPTFVASNHPFVSYLNARWKEFPRIDMSGGNVAHAAVSLARALGAATITLYGADFSYVEGKPYCRGTYLYDIFQFQQNRLAPLESRVFSFIFRSSDTRKERIGQNIRYTTGVLLDYRARLLGLMKRLDAEVIPVAGAGLPLDTTLMTEHVSGSGTGQELWKSSRARCGWRDFLGAYARDLSALPDLGRFPGRAFHDLEPQQRELWATLLPVAARVLMESADERHTVPALERARTWALSRVEHVLTGQAPPPHG